MTSDDRLYCRPVYSVAVCGADVTAMLRERKLYDPGFALT
jgi:hypothetical protein